MREHCRRCVQYWLATAAAACCLMLGAPVAANDILRPDRDDITQLVLDSCPNLVQAQFDDGRHQWSFQVCGLVALYEKLETYSRQPEAVLIRDYASIAEAERMKAAMRDSSFRAKPRFIRASNAWYLFDASGDESVTHAPHIYAFRTKAAAQKAQADLGGKLLDWAEVSRRTKALAEEWDRHAGHEVESWGRPG